MSMTAPSGIPARPSGRAPRPTRCRRSSARSTSRGPSTTPSTPPVRGRPSRSRPGPTLASGLGPRTRTVLSYHVIVDGWLLDRPGRAGRRRDASADRARTRRRRRLPARRCLLPRATTPPSRTPGGADADGDARAARGRRRRVDPGELPPRTRRTPIERGSCAASWAPTRRRSIRCSRPCRGCSSSATPAVASRAWSSSPWPRSTGPAPHRSASA